MSFKMRSKSLAKPHPMMDQTVTTFASRNLNPDFEKLSPKREFFHLNNTRMNFHLPKLSDATPINRRINSFNQTFSAHVSPNQMTNEKIKMSLDSERYSSGSPSRREVA